MRKNGILIGRVKKVSFAPQGGVNVEVQIDANVELRRGEVPQVSGSLLGGDVVIQFVLPPAAMPPPAAPQGGGASRAVQRCRPRGRYDAQNGRDAGGTPRRRDSRRRLH